MQIKGLKKLKTLCDNLGIVYVYELLQVYNKHKIQGESVVSTLERIIKEKQ